MQGGPQVHFFLLLFVLFTNNMFSLIRIYTNDTHRREPLLAGWWIPYPAAYETTATPASNCSRGGPSFVSPGAGGVTAAPWPSPAATTGPRQHRREQLLAGWIPPHPPTTMTMTWCRRRRQLLYSKGLAIAGAPRCRSYTTGDGGSTRTRLTRGS